MFRVVTYNIHGSVGTDGRRQPERIAGVLSRMMADVACLQEVHRLYPAGHQTDQANLIAEITGRTATFQQTAVYGLRREGLATLTRGAPAVQQHVLPSNGEPRGVLETRIRRGDTGELVRVFNTHWGLKSEERWEQAGALAAIICSAPEPTIVCGDMNEQADGPAVRRLREESGLQDAGGILQRGTFPADKPTVRIDYVLASKELRVQKVAVRGFQASDHLPVMVDFR